MALRDDHGDHQRSNTDGEHAGEQRDDHRLDELSADQVPAWSADRAPDRDVAPLPLGADEEEVRHVGAGDQQQDASRPEQDPERRLRAARAAPLSSGTTRGMNRSMISVYGGGAAILLRQPARDQIELRDERLRLDARLDPSDQREPEVAGLSCA